MLNYNERTTPWAGQGGNEMRIAEARRKAGMTQAALARAAGVTETCVYQWEHGLTVPTTKRLKLIADTLGVTVDELL